ncbi:MAG TPA: hypothetical protein PLB87_09990 [Prolixibacteraceae bacterium]|nr:hypothetical protein [Prolixibacteraceae bacterium]
MKRLIFTLLLLFPYLSSLYCQTKTLPQIENELHQSYQKILSLRYDSEEVNWDALAKQNTIFREKMSKYISTFPQTITYEFDSLQKDGIDIITSNDQLLRIYSWETYTGGTMRLFGNLFQYQSGNKVFSVISDTINLEEGDYVPFYTQIYTLATNNRTYYLAINNGIYSTSDVSQSIKIFKIEKNRLVDANIIKTKSGLSNSIDVYYDFFSVSDRTERPLNLIKFDPEKKMILVPIVFENGKVTERFIIYQFKGKYFELSEIQKTTDTNKN